MSPQCANGVVVDLFAETRFDGDFGPVIHDGFRGFTLSIMVEDVQGVEDAHRLLSVFDDIWDLDPKPSRSGFGCGFYFGDPEGNVWAVAHKYGAEIHRDGVFYP